MTSPNGEPSLPRVTEADILGLCMEEVLDPDHEGWGKVFRYEQRNLWREVAFRAFVSASRGDKESSTLEKQKEIMDIVAFVLRALRAASQREQVIDTPGTTPEVA